MKRIEWLNKGWKNRLRICRYSARSSVDKEGKERRVGGWEGGRATVAIGAERGHLGPCNEPSEAAPGAGIVPEHARRTKKEEARSSILMAGASRAE